MGEVVIKYDGEACKDYCSQFKLDENGEPEDDMS